MASNDVKLYIEYRNQYSVLLPVNPEKLTITSPGTNITKTVVSLGEINLLKYRGLNTIKFDSFIPKSNNGGGYLVSQSALQEQDFYISFFKGIQEQQEPINFVVSGLGVNIPMAIESFEYWWEAGDPDMYYTLSLKEYRSYSVKKVETSKDTTSTATVTTSTARTNTAKKVAIGVTVRVNGRLYRDSYGNGPGVVEKNATRKVNFIKEGRKCPYHVTNLEGGWRGWVTADSVEVI